MIVEADSEGLREEETLAWPRCTARNAINPFSALAKSASFPDSETPPHSRCLRRNAWWAHQDLNLEPTDYESAALTN
jgi:hypothetical protein